MALGAPCFFEEDIVGEADGDSPDAAVADGVSGGDADIAGDTNGSGGGRIFFFRWGEMLGEGVADIFFFFGLGDGDSDSVGAGEAFFFLVEGVTAGAGDSSSLGGEGFFVGEGVGLGELFLLEGLFFFRGFGVGVGVEKSFLRALPSVSSAAVAAGPTGGNISARIIRRRISIPGVLTDNATNLLNTVVGLQSISRRRTPVLTFGS